MVIEEIAIDTSVLIPYFQNDLEIIDRLDAIKNICVPIFVIGEMMIGFFMTKTSETAKDNFEFFLSKTRILECTRDVANKYGELVATLREKGSMIPANDIWIAACCLVHNKYLATKDEHFLKVPQLAVEIW